MYKTSSQLNKIGNFGNADLVCQSTQKPLQTRPIKRDGSKELIKKEFKPAKQLDTDLHIEASRIIPRAKFILNEVKGSETLRKKEIETRISQHFEIADPDKANDLGTRMQSFENASQMSSLSIDRNRTDMRSR
jgi:hypothetical protein